MHIVMYIYYAHLYLQYNKVMLIVQINWYYDTFIYLYIY